MSKEVTVKNEFDGIEFLKQIESVDKISKKVQIINNVLNQENTHIKNLKKEMKKKGFNAGNNADFDYIPIGILEEALRQVFFRQVDFEIKNSYRDLNSFIVVSRIRYKDPITNEFRFVDGIGAKALQQDKGSSINDFNSTMKFNALELGVGNAYSRSIKNAAKKLGNYFGGNLNRDDEMQNVNSYSKEVVMNDEQKLEQIIFLFENKKEYLTEDQLINIERIIELKQKNTYNQVIKYLEKL
tara:strand:- start:396 stop:1118 length:723 start_codon:yes stop_codon:yes gene_type:complete